MSVTVNSSAEVKKWFEESFFKYSLAIIMILLIIVLLYHIAPVLSPILWFAAAVFIPILFSTILYYILRPMVNYLDRWLPRYIAILVTYFFLAILITLVSLMVVPEIVKTFSGFSTERLESVKFTTSDIIEKLKSYIPFSHIPTIENILVSYVPKINAFIYKLAVNLVSTLASIAISLALTPFVLYYFLRDDSLFSKFILRFIPNQFQEEVQTILNDVDDTLSEFIVAQLMIAGIVGFFLFCGYLIIGLPHPLALALFAMIFYVIPFLGTFIAIIPALLIAISISFPMTLKVIAVMFVAHFIEANLLTPRLMSMRLKIHPLTVILLLLAAGTLYGILGLLLVTPTYAIFKVIVWNIYKISRLHYTIAKSKAAERTSTELPTT